MSDKAQMLASHLLLRRARDVGRYELPTERTDATTAAATNFERNRAAIEGTWPRAALCLPDALPELEWLYARDGALSARHVDRQWFGDCSVPRRAAERMFARLVVGGPTAVMLAPTHAQQVRAVLNRLASDQALIVVVPGEQTAGVIAACVDFTEDINAGRLWFAAGPDWAEELQAILDRNEGIAPASLMVRVPGLNAEIVEAIHKPCETILSKHAQGHRQRIELLMAKPRFPRTPAQRVCVMSGAFELWNGAASQLGDLAERASADLECVNVDTSKPAMRSSLNFARMADGCDAIVTANVGRSDRSGTVPTNVPWTVWATTRVPAFDATAPHDSIVIADEAMRTDARTAGWPAHQIRVAAEPIDDVPSVTTDARVAVIADLAPIAVPKAIEDMSSHRVIWDAIERDLTSDPLRIGHSAERYVLDWCDRLGVPRETFPATLVVTALVAPLFEREVTRQLVRRGAPIDIWGRGWHAVEDVRPMWRGAIETRSDLRTALARTRAIVDLWPLATTHPARRTGRPTIAAGGRTWNTLLSAIKTSPAVPTARPAKSFNLADAARS